MMTLIDGNAKEHKIQNLQWDAGLRDIRLDDQLVGYFAAILWNVMTHRVMHFLRGRGDLISTDPDSLSPYSVDIKIETIDGKVLWFRRFRLESSHTIGHAIYFEGIYLG